jgi:hypothetical protein
MPLSQNLAIVSETNRISSAGLSKVSAALQKQAVRDFGPVWEVQAIVSPFASLDDVPVDYWPVIVRDDIGVPGAAGIHLDQNGQPFALVQWSPEWSLTASHEVLEMLADPFGNRLVAGNSPKLFQGRVNFLVEVCDPSESNSFAYKANGILVSDFYTPHFFDPVRNSSVRYSFTGAIKKPRQILAGGYLSWVVPSTNEWWQQTWFSGSRPTFRKLGVLDAKAGCLRSAIDAITVTPEMKRSFAGKSILAAVAKRTAKGGAADDMSTYKEVKDSSAARAAALRTQIAAIKEQTR